MALRGPLAVVATLGAGLGVAFLLWLRRRPRKPLGDALGLAPSGGPGSAAAGSDPGRAANSEEKPNAATAAATTSPKNLSVSWAAQAAQAAKDAMATKRSNEVQDPPAAPAGLGGSGKALAVVQAEKKMAETPMIEAIKEFIVDNSLLQAQTPGLVYRRTKSSTATVENAWEPWGNVVKGMDEGDWLRVGQHFLPKTLGGIVVLHPKSSKKRLAKNCAAPQYVDCMMSWPTCSDFPALDAESSHHSASSSVRSMGEGSAAVETPRKVPIPDGNSHGKVAKCPSHGWQYLDQTGTVQGPFSLDEMRHWNRKGYFRKDLLMRCHPEDSFIALAALFPPPLAPFQSHPKRPCRPKAPRSESPR